MYLTPKMLDDTIQALTIERDNLGEPKKRGKGRNYSSPETDEYILDTYTIFICRKLKLLIKRGDYSIKRVTAHLKNMDWSHYSFSGKAYTGKKLENLIGIRYKKETSMFYLSVQGRYLTRASVAVAGILESYE